MRLGNHLVRGLGVLLAVALVGVMLTGCGGSGSLSTFGGSTTPVVTVTPTPTATTTPGDDPPYFYTQDASGNNVALGAGDSITITEGAAIPTVKVFAVDPEAVVIFSPLAMDVPAVVMTVPAAGTDYMQASDWVWDPDANSLSYTPNYDTVQPGEASRVYTFNWRISDGVNPDVTYTLTVTVLNQIYIDTFAGGGNGAGLPALYAGFNNPTGVAYDPYGNLYVCIHGTNDYRNPRVVRIKPNGILENVAGNGRPGYNGDSDTNGVLAEDAAFKNPFGIDVDDEQNVYVADADNNRIRKVSSDGRIFTLAGTGVAGFAGDGGVAGTALLNQPTSVSLDVPGNLYFSDTKNQRIRKIDIAGGSNIIQTVAGSGTRAGDPLEGIAGLNALQTPISGPRGLAVDSSDQLHFCEADLNGYLRVNLISGNLSRETYDLDINDAGEPIWVYPKGAYGTTDIYTQFLFGLFFFDEDRQSNVEELCSFDTPLGVTVDDTGNVIVADTGNNAVRMVVTGGNVWNLINRPNANTGIVEAFLPDGVTFAGNPVVSGGVLPASQGTTAVPLQSTPTIDLKQPADVDYYGATGHLAVADSGNNRVLVMTDISLTYDGVDFAQKPSDDTVRWVAGDKNNPTYAGDYVNPATGNSIGTEPTNASFNKPQGVGFRVITGPPDVVDVYIADTYHNCVRKFTYTGNPSSAASSTIERFAGSRVPRPGTPLGSLVAVDGEATVRANYTMTQPTDVDPISDTAILVCEAGNGLQGRILHVDAGAGPLAGVCQHVNYTASGADGLPGRPWSLVFSAVTPSRGWVSDYQRHCIWQLDFNGTYTALTAAPVVVAGLADYPAYTTSASVLTDARFRAPTSMAYWNSGAAEFLLVCDTGNHRVAQIQVGGAMKTLMGRGTSGYIPSSGDASGTFLDSPSGVWAHPSSGAIWVSDTDNNWIRKISGWDPLAAVNTPTQTVVAGTADRSAGFGGDSGIPTDVALNQPSAVIGIPDPSDTVDPTAVKWVYFADAGNHRIRVLESDG